MNEFKTYHPIVNFIYFVLVIGFSCLSMHPVCLFISLICGFAYSVMLKGKKAVKTNLIYMLPMLLFMALINPLFNHAGSTIIAYFPNGNPLTLESILYGLCAATMLASVIYHFSCYNEVMTSDKFIYIFGKMIPAMSLVISMTLRFVPRFLAQLKVVTNAQKCLGRDISSGNMIKRAKNGLAILSIMATWSLENGIETADSMKARGYGIPGRTAFSIYTIETRDKLALILVLLLGAYTFVGNLFGGMSFQYFPSLIGVEMTAFNVSVFLSYFLLCSLPIILEIKEAMRWKALRSKI